jgi:iron complex transport system substrate-binding protein
MCGLISHLIPSLPEKAGDFLLLFSPQGTQRKTKNLPRIDTDEPMKPSPVLSLALLIMIACSASSAEVNNPQPQRIISLSPATTEILFALGEGDRIVGVTSFCDYPEEAKKKQKIGGMSNPSLEAIVALKPDLVVMTTDGNPREVEERLRNMGLRTYVWTERKLAELPHGIRALASALGIGGRGEQLATQIERGVEKYGRITAPAAVKKKVIYIVWPEPLLVAGPGTAIDDAIMLLGLENTARRALTSYPRYSIEEVIREAPEVVFIGRGQAWTCGTCRRGYSRSCQRSPQSNRERSVT